MTGKQTAKRVTSQLAIASLLSVLPFSVVLAHTEDNLAAQYLIKRGKEKLKQGDADAALADFTKAVNSSPNYPETYRSRSQFYLQRNQPGKAIADLNKLLKLDPSDGAALFMLAQCHQRLNQHDEAIATFTRVLEARDDFTRRGRTRSRVYYLRGQLWQAKQEHARAAADYTFALKLDESLPGIRQLRGQALANSKQYDAALEDFAAEYQRGRKSYALLTNWAWLLATCPDAECRDGQRALQLIKQCRRTDDWTKDITAAAYAELGRFDEALAIVTQIADQFDRQQPSPLQKKILARIELYKAGKPYRDQQYGKDD